MISRTAACAAIPLAIFWSGCKKPEAALPLSSDENPKVSTAAEKLTTASAVLDRMAEAYKKAAGYSDSGTLRLAGQTARGPVDWSAPYAVKFVRPNKLRLELNDGTIATDGKQWCARIGSLPSQVVVRDPPARFTMEVFSADNVLAQALGRWLDGQLPPFPPSAQLPLLLIDRPIAALLAGADEPGLVEPGKIGDAECYRVQVHTPQGPTVFWIDEQTLVLRRIVYPASPLYSLFGGEKQVESLSLVAEFVGAKLDAEVDPKAFQLDIPQGAERVKMFLPPDIYQLLGKQIPDFTFVDRQGKSVTAESLAGKVVVLGFWDTGCEPCRLVLPEIEKLYQKLKDRPKLAMFAVSLDPKDVDNKAVEDVLSNLKVTLPLLRDPQQQAAAAMRVYVTPTLLVLGSDGVLQQCEAGDMKAFLAGFPERLEKLLAGEDLAKEAAARYRSDIQRLQKSLDDVFQGKVPETTVQAKVAETRPRTQPKKLTLGRLWKAAELKSPGNILVVPGADEDAGAKPPAACRIFVIDELKAIQEIGADGKRIATHRPEPGDELLTSLRTAVSGEGKRIFAVFMLSGQQFFCFDQDWKQILAYPDAAIKTSHKGIADVELGDADGSGVLRAYVGYYDAAGIQEVSLQGKRLRSNRTMLSVVRTALTPPDAQKRRSLVCAYQSDNGALAVLDAKLDRQGEILVPNWPIGSIRAADLRGDGKPLWAALSVGREGQTVIVGTNLQGEALWTYPLPKGLPRQPIEPIIPGRITVDGPGVWILPGADGSIHFIAADGKPIDQFNYGATLGGLATAVIDGKPVLLVASENGLEALRIEANE
jgi:peroxiredoxin